MFIIIFKENSVLYLLQINTIIWLNLLCSKKPLFDFKFFTDIIIFGYLQKKKKNYNNNNNNTPLKNRNLNKKLVDLFLKFLKRIT